ncbi:MAG TPA: DUF3108 domain-containing protein [Paracoccaceae bacterium]|nr:DUF3108 domain-containing protein [Paracoccaceae bacterium]
MRIRRLMLGSALALGLLAGEAGAENQVFGVTLSGLPAGEIVLSGRQEGGRYEAGSSIRAIGLLGALARLRYEGTTVGRIAGDGSLEPERHLAEARSLRSERRTEILFDNGDPVQVTMVPPRSRQLDPAEQDGTIDPVSAVFQLLLAPPAGAVCNRRVELFDGARRSRVELGQAELRDGALVCNGRYVRLSGEEHAIEQSDYGFRLFFHGDGAGGVTLWRIEAPTRYGLAVATRRG